MTASTLRFGAQQIYFAHYDLCKIKQLLLLSNEITWKLIVSNQIKKFAFFLRITSAHLSAISVTTSSYVRFVPLKPMYFRSK
jgi:hypothetical protein